MYLSGFDPRGEKPGLWNDFIHMRPLKGGARLLYPLQSLWAFPYLIYELFSATHWAPYLNLKDTGFTHHLGRKTTFYRYAEIEIVVAAYRTEGYVKQSDYTAFSFLEFHFAEEVVRIYHKKRVGIHEKALRKLVEKGVRIESTRNDQPSRYGRKFLERD